MKIIALEESFWYEKLTTEGSTVSHVQVKSAVAADWQRKLVDFTEYRLPDMDRNGVDVQVLSLTSPGIQVQPDPDIAVADARTANDFLADIIKEHPQRFAGLAAIPLTACVRGPDEDKPGVRRQEVRTYATTTPALLELRDWMARQGATLGVMEPPRRTGSRRPTCPRTTSPARWSTPATSRASPAGLKRTSTRSGCASSPSGACSGPRSSRPAAPAARPDPLPAHLDPGTDPGKAARRETARRCPDRAVGGDQRHLRRLRPGHARRPGGQRSARRSAPCAATGRAEPHVGIPPDVRRTDPPRPPCQRGDRPADPPCPAVSARTAWISPGAPSFFRRQSRS